MTQNEVPQKPVPAEAAAELIDQGTQSLLGPNPFVKLQPRDLLAFLGEVGKHAVQNPRLVLEQQAALARDLVAVFTGKSDLAPVAGDKRFGDEAWTENWLYRTSLQTYLAYSKAVQEFVGRLDMSDDNKARAAFAVNVLFDTLAPTNSLLGNPAALKKAAETKGASLLAGMRNFLDDMVENGGLPAQVDKKAFKIGGNLAVSLGQVVLRTPLLELIQYKPETPSVHARPHLFVSPQVNKFYVLDLAPNRSVVEYLVKGGFQVFVVSWRNPTSECPNWSLDDYIAELLKATDAVREITGSDDLIMHAACSGGMTTTALAGYLAVKNDRRIHAMTLMAVSLDGTDSTTALFATPEVLAASKAAAKIKGVTDAKDMARGFAMMRPNEAIWNFWVNNYLMGNAPPTFDVFYWSSDATRLSANFYSDLMDMSVEGRLLRPGAMTVLGTPVDISRIDCDKFILAGTTDHITPWKGCYKVARQFGGTNQFTLAASGHIQSILSPPPGHPKAKFFVNPDKGESPDEWLKQAKTHTGSWWPVWKDWLTERSGDLRPAPSSYGNARYQPVAAAPGSYVHE